MGRLPVIALLITVVAGRSSLATERVSNLDRIITTCTEETMVVLLKKDLEQFSLHGEEPECQPVLGKGKNAYGQPVNTKTWTLPLKESGGPCGLKFARVPDTNLWAFSTTLHGTRESREVSCIRTGILDKRGAQIKLDIVNGPKIIKLEPEEGEEDVVEIPQRATVRANFFSHFPASADISLHPLTCWLVDDFVLKRWLVIEKGCPIKDTSVVIGSSDADHVTGQHPHVFFNAEQGLFEGQNATSRFRLQCTVFPCKGHSLARQIIGVDMCPPVAWCQDNDYRIEETPRGTFDVDQLFSVEISPSDEISPKLYRPLRAGHMYPAQYWPVDTNNAEKVVADPSYSCLYIYIAIGSAVLCLLVLIAALFYFGNPGEQVKHFRERWRRVDEAPMANAIYPEKPEASVSMGDNDKDNILLVLTS